MKKRSELFFNLLQLPVDSIAIIAGFVAAYFIREGQAQPFVYFISGYSYLAYMVLLLPVWIALFAILGLYSFGSVRSRLSEIGKIISATAATTMVLIIIDFFTTEPIFPAKSIPIYGFLFSTLFVIAGRLLLNSIQKFLFRFDIGTYTTLLIGKNGVDDTLAASYSRQFPHFRTMRRRVDLSREQAATPLHQLAGKDIDQIVVTQSNISEENVLFISNYCEKHGITLKFVPTISNILASSMISERVGNIPVLEIRRTPLEGWGRIIKRIFDLVVTLLALIVLSPLLLLLAVIIKISDPGKVLYAHKRLSREGKAFLVYKFRTMKVDFCTGGKYGNRTDLEAIKTFNDPKLIEEWQRDQKLKKDPRVSRIGRFLRSTSLDELPQLFNILKGNLSIVGPRPIVQDELERYGKHSNVFLMIKPGLTGLWQVSGRNDIGYDQRVKLDIYYIEHWSLWLDLKIILQTAWMLLRGRNGY